MTRFLHLLTALSLLISPAACAQNSLWGTTNAGGTGGGGVLFEFSPANNAYKKWHNFSTATGSTPTGRLLYDNGLLWGTTAKGGTTNGGVIFTFDAATGQYNKKADFTAATGTAPIGGLTAYNGKFYGMANAGGASGVGTIYEYDPALNTLTALISLQTAGATGGAPVAGFLVQNGLFYGTTTSTSTGCFSGELFSFHPATAAYTTLSSFCIATGTAPNGNVALYNNRLYGTTPTAGPGNAGQGTIFGYDLAGMSPASVVYAFPGDSAAARGSSPGNDLTLYNNKFYGLTFSGGATAGGVLFEFDPANGVFVKRYDFNSSVSDGRKPSGALTPLNGRLYGATVYGGSLGDYGTLFSFNPATGGYSTLYRYTDTAAAGAYPTSTVLVVAPASVAVPAGAVAAASGVVVYPNPAGSTLHVRLSAAQPARFVLTDMTGREVVRQQLALGENEMAVAQLAPGMYGYRVINERGLAVATGRLVKQ